MENTLTTINVWITDQGFSSANNRFSGEHEHYLVTPEVADLNAAGEYADCTMADGPYNDIPAELILDTVTQFSQAEYDIECEMLEAEYLEHQEAMYAEYEAEQAALEADVPCTYCSGYGSTYNVEQGWTDCPECNPLPPIPTPREVWREEYRAARIEFNTHYTIGGYQGKELYDAACARAMPDAQFCLYLRRFVHSFRTIEQKHRISIPNKQCPECSRKLVENMQQGECGGVHCTNCTWYLNY